MMIYMLYNISIIRDIVLYILEYKHRLLFPFQTLETRQRQNETGVYVKHLSIPIARISRKCLVKLATSSFLQLLHHLYSLEISIMTT